MTLPVSRSSLGVFFTLVYGERGKFPEDFAVGMLAATLYVYLTNAPKKDVYARFMQRLSLFMSVGALLFYVYTAMRFYNPHHYSWPLLPGLFRFIPWNFDLEIDFALCYGCLMLAVLFARPGGRLRRIFEWDPLRWLGALSFSLYIWHAVFISVIERDVVPEFHFMNHYVAILLTWILALALIFPFCFLIYVIIEKPGMRFSEQLRKRMLQKKSARTQTPAQTLDASEQATLPLPRLPSRPLAQEPAGLAGSVPEQVDVRPGWSFAPSVSAQNIPVPGRLVRSRHRLQPLSAREPETQE